ncbi:MAG: hypothetical protein WCY43_01450 [Patescibacteria group bacterium]|nr:hypothetical protein [Patescibacteria group bacterium]
MNFENATLDKKAENEELKTGEDQKNERIVVEDKSEVTASDLAEADLKASEELNKARKSIFGKIGEMFKGREKTKEEKYEEDLKSLEKMIRSLTHTASISMDLGASFSSGIDSAGAKTPELKNKLSEIMDVNKKISKMDRGNEKVELLRRKKELIMELARMGRAEIENKYKNAA